MSLRVLAIDPGTQTHGLAVVEFLPEDRENILLREIVGADYLSERLHEAAMQFAPDVTVVGSGTGHKQAALIAQQVGLPDIRIVSEKNTTIQARYRYLQENPSPWYLRLIPKSLRLPACHCDDWAAVILAERIGRG